MAKKTHTVVSGDTLGKISVRYYGVWAKWTDIVKANPQLSGRKTASDGSPLIYPGDVLVILDDSDKKTVSPTKAKQTVVLDENSKQDLALFIDGKKFTGFTGYTLTRNVSGVDAFSFTSIWDGENETLKKVFSPFSYPECEVYYDGDMIFKGIVLSPTPSVDSGAKTITVQGYPLCGVLIDSCLPESLYPAEYNGLTLKEIAETVCEPFGVSVVIDGDVGEAFEKVEVELSDKVWDFLNKLAEQRGLQMTNKADGSLLIYKPATENSSQTFVQGEFPFISCTPQFDAQKMYSHITGYTKTTNEKDSQKYTYENKALIKKGVLRCFAKTIEDASDSSLEDSVKALAGEMFANCVKYSVTVSGHRDKNGSLYRENMAVSLKAPGAEVYKETKLLADSVTMKRDDSSGLTTEFSLVLPGSRDGSLPEEFPWE